MAENQFTSTIESLFKGLDQFVTTKTVVGEPVQVGETIIIPLIDVTCGMAAGAFAEGAKQKQRGGGGMSAKMSPSAVLVIQGGVTKLVNVKNQDAVTKVIDMAPDLINKFLGGRPPISEETVQAAREQRPHMIRGRSRWMRSEAGGAPACPSCGLRRKMQNAHKKALPSRSFKWKQGGSNS